MNMSQQCVLIMNKAVWGTSVASRSIEDFLPFTQYWCGPIRNTMSSFGPSQFNRDVQKLERVQGRGHKFQLGRFKLVIMLYLEGSTALEQRGGGVSTLWCLQGSLTKPLTLSCVDDSPYSGSRLDLGDFPHVPSNQHFWDSVSDSSFKSSPRKWGIQKLQALKQNLEDNEIPLPPFPSQGHYFFSLGLVMEYLLTETSRLTENNPFYSLTLIHIK